MPVQHIPETVTSPAQPLDKGEVLKKQIDLLSSIATLAYKIAATVGGLITFAYLFSIEYFPIGLTAGDVVFFVFIGLAFGFLYIVLLLYGAFSAIWLARVLTWFFHLPRFRSKIPSRSLSQRPRQDAVESQYSRWNRCRRWVFLKIRGARLIATRLARRDRNLVPTAARGVMLTLMSAFAFFVMFLTALVAQSRSLDRLLFSFYLAGFVALMSVAGTATGKRDQNATFEVKRNLLWLRWVGVFVLPMFIILITNESILLQLAFQKLGIRVKNVSIEVNETEAESFGRVSSVIGRPLIDCRKTPGGRLLMHNVDVLWTGIGSETLISFAVLEPSNLGILGPEPNILKRASLHLDTKSVRIFKTMPPIDPCFDFPSDQLFTMGKYELTSEALLLLQEFAAVIQKSDIPSQIVVRDYNDSMRFSGKTSATDEGNRRLSELRAATVAETLQRLIREPHKTSKLVVFSEGLGGRESMTKCPPDAAIQNCSQEQCNSFNRRIEIHVSYGRSGALNKWQSAKK